MAKRGGRSRGRSVAKAVLRDTGVFMGPGGKAAMSTNAHRTRGGGNKGSFGNYKVSKNAPDINKGGNFGPV
jgi:hypothetical protein